MNNGYSEDRRRTSSRMQNGNTRPNRSGMPRNGSARPSSGTSGKPSDKGSKKQVFAYRTKQIISTGIAPMILISRNEGKIKTVKSKKKTPIPISVFILAVICTLVFMFMIVSYVQINEYTLEVAALRSEIAELSEEEKQLNLDLDRKNDLRSIEQYVSENLGMVKSDQIVKKHVSVASEDKIEVVSAQPIPDENVVSTLLSSLARSFGGFWEYIG
ncbi:MAG: septum formation initiator family protein [Clostridia bacterium]|nr:septum formation initiator family protein [Clostridia bacterium]